MPGYPVAVSTFPTLQDGVDYPQVAHVNPLGVEVTAIENALLNGIPHAVTISTGGLTVSTGSVNIGGPSSLATLQVNGASTFAGAVTFGVSPTFAGAVVSTGVIRQVSIPAWSVYYDSTQTIASTAATALLLNQSNRVSGDIGYGAASTTTRVTVNTTGWYQVNAHVQFESGTDPGDVSVLLRQNGSAVLHSAVAARVVGSSQSAQSMDFSQAVYIASTGYLELVAYTQLSGAGSTFGSTIAARRNVFSGFFVG